jgi:hypothetical protein
VSLLTLHAGGVIFSCVRCRLAPRHFTASFDIVAVYRGNVIFGILPLMRAMVTPHSVSSVVQEYSNTQVELQVRKLRC